MIPETSPTLSPDSTLPTTTSPTHLATSNSFQFMTTTGTTTVNSLSAMNPATSMMINLDDHSFYQHILSPQQLQQLQLQQHPQNISAISQPSQHLTPYIEHSLNFVQQHYDLGLGISTPPTPNNGGRMQHTVTANPTPPLSKELVSSQDLPAASTASLINSNSTSGSITLPYQQQQQHSNSPIGGGISGSSDTTASMARSKTNNHERSPIYSSALQTTPPDTSLDNTKLQQQTYQHAEQFNQSNMVGLQGLNASTPSPSHQHATRSSPLENSMLLTSNDTQTIGKRSNQDISSSKESSPTTNKKVKQDTNYQLEKSPTPMYFTAASFQYRTREQLIDRLVVLENERVDLLRQTGQSRRKDKLSDEKHKGNRTASPSSVNNNTHTSDDESLGKITNHTNDNSKEEDEDEDDDDDEESESISSVTDNNLNDTSSGNDNTEMRCLWRNCGMACIGVQGLTDHIVRVHVGGGKPLYHCEWENCRRIQKPFTKRHKICNHLRVHTGERPFVCEKPGCEKRFSRPDSLVTHAKTHSTVRPFTCHIPGCEKAYYHIRSLRKHLKLHEEEQTYEYGGGSMDTSNFNMNMATATTVAAAGTLPLQQSYNFTEQPFIIQPGATLNAASIHNKQMGDPSLIDPSHSLFDPLAFQALSSLQTPHPPQYIQLGPSPIPLPTMAGTNDTLNIMDPPPLTAMQQNQYPS